jgi:hypothetical protein
MGRASEPTAAIIDAQSTRTSPQGGESGFDAGKKVKGRKRNLVVDRMGLVIALTVTAASVQDRDAAAAAVAQACAKAPGLEKLYTDASYGGKCARTIVQTHHIVVEVVRRLGNLTTGTLHDPAQSAKPIAEMSAGFVVLPKRWSSSAPTHGPNVGAGRSCIMTTKPRFQLLGCGWQKRVCYSLDSLIRIDFVYTLLATYWHSSLTSIIEHQARCLPLQ